MHPRLPGLGCAPGQRGGWEAAREGDDRYGLQQQRTEKGRAGGEEGLE